MTSGSKPVISGLVVSDMEWSCVEAGRATNAVKAGRAGRPIEAGRATKVVNN